MDRLVDRLKGDVDPQGPFYHLRDQSSIKGVLADRPPASIRRHGVQ